MKKVLAYSILAICLASCMSAEQKAEEQAKNEKMVDEKVDEIMQKLDKSNSLNADTSSAEHDSTAQEITDSTVAE